MKREVKIVIITFLVIVVLPLISLPFGSSSEKINIIENETQTVKVLDVAAGNIISVNLFDLVVGCVAAEMPSNYHIEAIKAQAVATYSYICYGAEHATEEYAIKINDGDSNNFIPPQQFGEVFGDQGEEYYKMFTEVISEIYGVAVTFDGVAAEALYHTTSPGITESAANMFGTDVPYLKSVDSSVDIQAAGYSAAVTFTADELKSKLAEYYPDIVLEEDPAQWLNILGNTISGTVTKIKVGDDELTGRDIRALLDLTSCVFSLSFENNVFTFTVLGKGHGVGLSQTGAQSMALDGSKYFEILLHYYSGTTVETYAYKVEE